MCCSCRASHRSSNPRCRLRRGQNSSQATGRLARSSHSMDQYRQQELRGLHKICCEYIRSRPSKGQCHPRLRTQMGDRRRHPRAILHTKRDFQPRHRNRCHLCRRSQACPRRTCCYNPPHDPIRPMCIHAMYRGPRSENRSYNPCRCRCRYCYPLANWGMWCGCLSKADSPQQEP